MTHSRACPKCEKIVPWTKTERVTDGPHGPYWKVKLICPIHGEFRNRAELMALNGINQVAKET